MSSQENSLVSIDYETPKSSPGTTLVSEHSPMVNFVLHPPMRVREKYNSVNALNYLRNYKCKHVSREEELEAIKLKNRYFVAMLNKEHGLVTSNEENRVDEDEFLNLKNHFRMAHCPFGCKAVIDIRAMFSHYMDKHFDPNASLVDMNERNKRTLTLFVNLPSMEQDQKQLIRVFAYERRDLNPNECQRNCFLSKHLQKYSKHTVMMFFACRTFRYFISECLTNPIGIHKELKEILIIWAASPTPNVPIALRATIRDPEKRRYYRKYVSFRNLQDNQIASQFIDEDKNCVICSIDEMLPLSEDKTLKLHILIREINLHPMRILNQKIASLRV